MQGCSKGTISIENVNVIEHVLPLYSSSVCKNRSIIKINFHYFSGSHAAK